MKQNKSKVTPHPDKATELTVESHLNNHREIDTSMVEINVKDGNLTLSGEIDNERAKQLVGNICADEMQIKDVQNDISARRDISQAPAEEPEIEPEK